MRLCVIIAILLFVVLKISGTNSNDPDYKKNEENRQLLSIPSDANETKTVQSTILGNDKKSQISPALLRSDSNFYSENKIDKEKINKSLDFLNTVNANEDNLDLTQNVIRKQNNNRETDNQKLHPQNKNTKKNLAISEKSNSFIVSNKTKNAAKLTESRRIQRKCKAWFNWSKSYRNCLLNFMKGKNAWKYLHKAVAHCLGQSTLDMVDAKFLYNWDDTKLVILPTSYSPDCVEVTLGIGRDITAEKELFKMVPYCKFFGADPIFTSGKLFEELGTYYQIAVGAKDGVLDASVLEDQWYKTQQVPTVNFVRFLLTNVSRNFIDYLFLDNEGAEYEILPMFHRGSFVDVNNIVICQISVETHGPFEKYNMTSAKYDAFVKDIITESNFLPLWSAPPMNHLRMYLFNARHEYCIEKFLLQWCNLD